jgi:hypothetical protein
LISGFHFQFREGLFCSPSHPNMFWGQASLKPIWYRALSPRVPSGQSMKMKARLCLLPRLMICYFMTLSVSTIYSAEW